MRVTRQVVWTPIKVLFWGTVLVLVSYVVASSVTHSILRAALLLVVAVGLWTISKARGLVLRGGLVAFAFGSIFLEQRFWPLPQELWVFTPTILIALGLLATLVVQKLLMDRRSHFKFGSVEILMLGFLFVSLVSIVANTSYAGYRFNLQDTFLYAASFSVYFVFAGVILDSNEKHRSIVRRIAISMIVAAIVVNLVVLFSFVQQGASYHLSDMIGTPLGTYVNLSVFYFVVVSLVVGLFMEMPGKWLKLALLALVVFLVVAMPLFRSRTFWLATAVSVGTIAILKGWRYRFGAAAALVALLALPQVRRIIGDIFSSQIFTGTFDRLDVWRDALHIFFGSPIIGVGSGNYAGHASYYFWGQVLSATPHSQYLLIATEMGILGLGLLLALFFFALKTGWALYRNADNSLYRGLGLGFVGMVVGMAVAMGGGEVLLPNHVLYDYWAETRSLFYFWMAFGMIMAARELSHRAKSS